MSHCLPFVLNLKYFETRNFWEFQETSGTKPSPVLLANNVYVQIGFNFKSDFKHSLQHYLKAIPEGLNFADSVSSAQRINSWVKENSKGKITKLFEEGK